MPHRWIASLWLTALLFLFSQHAGAESCGDPIHCTPPQFYDESPTDGTSVDSLSHVEIVAAPETRVESVEFSVGGRIYRPVVTPLRSGAHLLTHDFSGMTFNKGPVVLRITAQNRVGDCWGMKAWIVNIR